MNPLALMAASYAASAAGTAISNKLNSSTQKDLIDYNQAYYSKNLDKNFALNREMVRSQKSDEVQSLRMAGLSPLLANGSFSGIANVQAPMGLHTAPDSKLDLLQANQVASNIQLAESQAKLADAEANKAESEATKIDIQNMEEEDYNATSSKNFKEFANRMKDNKYLHPDVRAMFKSVAEDETFATSRGGIQAFYDHLASTPKVLDSIEKELRSMQQINVVFDQIHDKRVHDSLVKMPFVQKQQFVANSIMLSEKANELQKLSMLHGSEVAVNSEQINKLSAEIDEIITRTRSEHHNDNLQMLEDGELGNVMLSVGGEAARELAHIAGYAVGAKAIGSRVSQKAGDVIIDKIPSKSSASKPSKLSQKQFNEQTKHLPKDVRESLRRDTFGVPKIKSNHKPINPVKTSRFGGSQWYQDNYGYWHLVDD